MSDGATRSLDQTFQVIDESTFATLHGSFEADNDPLAYSEMSKTLKHERIESPAVTTDGGSTQAGKGMPWTNSEVQSTLLPEGSGYNTVGDHWGYEDGETPSRVSGFAAWLASCLGPKATLRAGTTLTSGSHTSTKLIVSNAATNKYTAGDIIPILKDGRMYLRPVLTDNGGGDLDLGFELPGSITPAENDVIPGGFYCGMDRTTTASIQALFKGDLDERTWMARGMVGNLTLPETAVQAVQLFSATHRVADFDYDTSTINAFTRKDPSLQRSIVAGGGEFLLGRHGSTQYYPLEWLNFSMELQREYRPNPLANDPSNSLKCWSWVRTNATIRMLVRPNAAVPPGFTGTRYFDLFDSGGNESLFHFMGAWGAGRIGRTIGLYLPAIWLDDEPEEVDDNDLGLMALTFKLASGYGGFNKVRFQLV